MKRHIITTVAVTAAMTVFADSSVSWLGTVHDFGAFSEEAQKKTAYFRFVNTGDEPVTIISANATCGCTTPKYDKAPVAPGDTATIEVSYDPAGRPGGFSKQVYVRTTADNERTRLTIKGTVIGSAETVKARYPVSVGDLKLRNGAAMMGRVMAGGGKAAYVDGYNQSTDTIRPVVDGLPAYIEVKSIPEAVAPGEMVTFNFYFRGDRCNQWGMVTDSVTIAPNPGADGVAFPIVALIEEDFSHLTADQLQNAPRITVKDERVVLPAIPERSTSTVSRDVRITNTGKDLLVLRRVYTQDPGMEVKVGRTTLKKGESTELTIKYNPSVQPTGIVNGKITVISNDPAQPTITLRVVGERK